MTSYVLGIIAIGLMTAYKPETWPISRLYDCSGANHDRFGLFRDGNAEESRA